MAYSRHAKAMPIRALKHYMIAAGAGYDNSLKEIQEAFTNGDATKDDLEEARSAHKMAKDGMRSDQREAAAAAMASAQRNGGGISLIISMPSVGELVAE